MKAREGKRLRNCPGLESVQQKQRLTPYGILDQREGISGTISKTKIEKSIYTVFMSFLNADNCTMVMEGCHILWKCVLKDLEGIVSLQSTFKH